MKRKIFVISFGLSIGLGWTVPALADVFRCVAPEGDVTYADTACNEDSILSANVTELVRTCDTTECEAALQRSREEANVRLREERAALVQMQEMRLRAEAHELDRRLKVAQIEQLLDDTPPAAVGGGVYYPAYPLYPGVEGRRGNHSGAGGHHKPHQPRGPSSSIRIKLP